ncbi:MAG: hypothetical protein HZB31_03055 [Nitrospirae bacterium]|nr:hypothetical protein [Nitrospirota bacterium]
MPKSAITRLKTNVVVNDAIIPMNEFTQNYIGNVILGIVKSLGHSCGDVTVHIDKSGFFIYSEKGELPLLKDFARLLVESTIKGMISPLKGVFWLQSLIVTTRIVSEEAAASERVGVR